MMARKPILYFLSLQAAVSPRYDPLSPAG